MNHIYFIILELLKLMHFEIIISIYLNKLRYQIKKKCFMKMRLSVDFEVLKNQMQQNVYIFIKFKT